MNFTDILDDYNIPYITEGSEHCHEGWIQLDCPFCERDSKNWHLGYNLEENYFNCYRCRSHSMVDTLSELTGISIGQAIQLLKGIKTLRVEKKKHTGQLKLPDDVHPELLVVHKNYLKSRGFDYRHLRTLWDIQAIGMSADYSWRIFIPVYYQGQMVSWSTRSISHVAEKKYLNAPKKMESIPIKDLLYGEDFLRDTGIFVEGFTDAWNIGPGAAATMGVVYTQAQLEKMVKYHTRVVCFDNEPEAQRRALKLCDDLGAFPGDTYNVVLDAADPGEASAKEIKRLRKEFLI